jgi:hypothetical protein
VQPVKLVIASSSPAPAKRWTSTVAGPVCAKPTALVVPGVAV